MLLSYLSGHMTLFGFLSVALALMTALTIHEFAHAYSALRLGDDTAKRRGRVSLNPLVHFDPLGTTLILLGGFGWGKPVPVNDLRLKHPRSGMVWVSLWGPLSNILTAAVLVLMMAHTPLGSMISGARTVLMMDGREVVVSPAGSLAFLGPYLEMTVGLSLMLAFFNLIPIAPLDGSKVLSGLLPLGKAKLYDRFMVVWGLPLLFGLIFLPRIFPGLDLVGPWVGIPTSLFFRVLGMGG